MEYGPPRIYEELIKRLSERYGSDEAKAMVESYDQVLLDDKIRWEQRTVCGASRIVGKIKNPVEAEIMEIVREIEDNTGNVGVYTWIGEQRLNKT